MLTSLSHQALYSFHVPLHKEVRLFLSANGYNRGGLGVKQTQRFSVGLAKAVLEGSETKSLSC